MAGNVEKIKSESRGLRGSLLASLQDPLTGSLRESDQILIKYHGSYQQDNRDDRDQRRRAKLEPSHSFMIRTRTPGGLITPWQWQRLDDIAHRFAERGLRITTRQALQFHGVVKRQLKATMQAINQSLIDTLAACGDVNRNVAIALCPERPKLQAQLYFDASALSNRLLPATRAYYEIWLDDEPSEQEAHGSLPRAALLEAKEAPEGDVASGNRTEESDAIYGQSYLPRKFKIAFALPPVNDVDVYTQDLGFIAVIDAAHEIIGYDVTVGGGMGASHNDPETFPRLADTLGFIPRAALEAVAIAVITTQRDFGNRLVRKRARLKYTIEDRGIAWFKAEVESRSRISFSSPRAASFVSGQDRFGWYPAADQSDAWFLGLRIVAGRAQDVAGYAIQSALREVADYLQPFAPIRRANGESAPDLPIALASLRSYPYFLMTANQNLVLANLTTEQRLAVTTILEKHGVLSSTVTSQQPILRDAMACVALPTCGLAMAEAERYLPEFARKLQQRWDAHGLAETPLQIRLSGCPNGCSRPYTAELALVGKAPGRYNLFLGGCHLGTALNQLFAENIDEATILNTLSPVFERYQKERSAQERFATFLERVGLIKPRIKIKVAAA